ncbi:MAG: hypothetical protein U9Q03_00420 [Patescibacteria group bacterium]|nr:hypothetical protein [Patescibacteria group bacterium]
MELSEMAEYHLELVKANAEELRKIALEDISEGQGLDDFVLVLLDMSDEIARGIVRQSMPDVSVDDYENGDIILMSVSPEGGIELAKMAELESLLLEGLSEEKISLLTVAGGYIFNFTVPLVAPDKSSN